MSHFTVGVILERFDNPSDVEADIYRLMEPYDENIEVDEYMQVCPSCDGTGQAQCYRCRGEGEIGGEECHQCNGTKLIDCPVCHGEKEYATTYNPKSKWDWWIVGGRWSDVIPGNACVIKEFDAHPFFALVTPDGEWHEKGKMLWFAVVADEDDDWERKHDEILAKYPDHWVVLVDAHI